MRTLHLPALAGDARGPWREGEKGQIGETFRRQNHQELVSDWIWGDEGKKDVEGDTWVFTWTRRYIRGLSH